MNVSKSNWNAQGIKRRVLGVTLALSLSLPLAASAAVFDFVNDPDYTWADVEIDFRDDEINDIDLYYNGSDVYTDVFDTGGALFVTAGAAVDKSSDVQFVCDTGNVTVGGEDYILFECDGNSATYSGLDYTVSRSVYFWERGSKFRIIYTLTNKTGSPLVLSPYLENNYGSSGNNSHYAFGNSAVTSAIPFGNDPDHTADINAANAKWHTHYDTEDAPIGFAWGSDTASSTGSVQLYDGDDIEIAYENLTIPANNSVQLAFFYSWPVATLIAANYTNTSTQPLSQANEAYLSIASMQANPTEDMWALVADRSKIINWNVSNPVPPPPAAYGGPLVSSIPSANLTGASGEVLTLEGVRLGAVGEAKIGEQLAIIVSKTETTLVLRLPALGEGPHDLHLKSPGGMFTSYRAFEIAPTKSTGESTSQPTEGSTQAKVNAGSFKGYVALYAKGYKGKKLSAKVGNDWVIVESLESDYERIVEYTGVGYQINVRLYIDGILQRTIPLLTK